MGNVLLVFLILPHKNTVRLYTRFQFICTHFLISSVQDHNVIKVLRTLTNTYNTYMCEIWNKKYKLQLMLHMSKMFYCPHL